MGNTRFIAFCARLAARSGIIAFFIMAFEVMIMISPFAFFFYSVFNPVLHWLNAYPATRWLTGFFLPHMILPPTGFLKAVRILGSALFVVGALGFLACASQIYLGKILGRGVAARGLYKIVRHPQYLALGLWGAGMAILWPRFLVLATLSLMFVLYYFLAKDEEGRMLALHGGSYREYMDRTGMFLPKSWEKRLTALLPFQSGSAARHALIALAIPVAVIGTGFILRAVTLHSLPYQSGGNVTLVPILPEDEGKSREILAALLSRENATSISFLSPDTEYLGYVMPPDFVMQGMIADTGDAFHLHKQEHTFALIADWVFNPFEHLRRSPSAAMAAERHVDPAMARMHHCPLGITGAAQDCRDCPYRRVVFVSVVSEKRLGRGGLFAFGAVRTPVGFVDINSETGEIVNRKPVGKATAWRDVPTPEL